MLSNIFSFLFLNINIFASLLKVSPSNKTKLSPLICTAARKEGIRMFIRESRRDSAAILKLTRPLKDLSIGTIVSSSGINVTNFPILIL